MDDCNWLIGRDWFPLVLQRFLLYFYLFIYIFLSVFDVDDVIAKRNSFMSCDLTSMNYN